MMKKIGSIISGIVILLLLCSGIFTDIVKFFAWLFTLQYSQPDTSVIGGIIVRILTFTVSYGLVGLIFDGLGWFNKKAMSIAYFVISTLLGFALSYLIMIIEKYIVIIGIVLGLISLFLIMYLIVRKILKNKKNSNEKLNDPK